MKITLCVFRVHRVERLYLALLLHLRLHRTNAAEIFLHLL